MVIKKYKSIEEINNEEMNFCSSWNLEKIKEFFQFQKEIFKFFNKKYKKGVFKFKKIEEKNSFNDFTD